MNPMSGMRVGVVLVLMTCWLTAAAGSHAGIPARDRLVGAWRLVAIEYRSPAGVAVDPFYQEHSDGLLIYDASGWMSVYISGPSAGRPVWPVPEDRIAGRSDDGVGDIADNARKARAFDTFYGYSGTWSYDAQTGDVTHHLVASLIPAEVGMDYEQVASFEGGRLVLTTGQSATGPGSTTGQDSQNQRIQVKAVRRKIWQRVGPDYSTKRGS